MLDYDKLNIEFTNTLKQFTKEDLVNWIATDQFLVEAEAFEKLFSQSDTDNTATIRIETIVPQIIRAYNPCGPKEIIIVSNRCEIDETIQYASAA